MERVICFRDGKNRDQDEQARISLTSNIGPEQDVDVWVPLWLHATAQVWNKGKALLCYAVLLVKLFW